MATCPVCNKELIEGSRFCDGCGAQLFEQVFCPNCGQPTSTEFAYCQSCGAYIVEEPMAGQYAQQPFPVPKQKKNIPIKAIIFGAAGIAVIAVIVLAVILFGGKGKSEINYAMYIKDKEIFFNDLKKNSVAWQLTSDLVEFDEVSNDSLSDSGYYLSLYTFMSEDGKYIFYPDKIEDDEGFSLYYREVGKPEAEAIKVDSNVLSYSVNTSTTLVTYNKTDSSLYQYKLKEDAKDKISSEVQTYRVSSDGNKICYSDKDNSLYIKYADKEKELIASEITYLSYVNDDLTKIYYDADGSLYKKFEGEDKAKIASDVSSVLSVYDSGEIYYLKGEDEEVPLKNYVTDDMKDTDAAMTKPEYPDYPSWWDYETDAEYEAAMAAYETAYTAYEEAYDAYLEKNMRDRLRAELEEETIENTSYTLCFFNGTEEIVLTDSFSYDYNYTTADEAAVITYTAYNQSEFDNVKLSEIDSLYDVEEKVENALYSSSERYIAVKGTATVLEQQKKAVCFRINSSGSTVYYIDNVPDEESYGELYRISISNGSLGKPELYDSDVHTGSCDFADDNKFLYCKDFKDGKAELYIDKEKIDFDVYVSETRFLADTNKVIYFADYNPEKEQGTLKVYQNKEAIKIADDVHDFTVAPDGQIIYLANYSINNHKGELYKWDNSESIKLDDDVVSIFPVITKNNRGLFYEW